MKLLRAIGAALIGYLAGSLSSGHLVGRLFSPDEDVSSTTLELPGGATLEYEGVSATSVAAHSGPIAGMLTGTLDMAKAYVPTSVAMRVWPNKPYAAIIAAAAVAGHNYPIYHGFNGGRGMAPYMGGMLAMDPVAIPITQVAGITIGVGAFRDMYAAYMGGMWLTVPWFLWRRRPAEALSALATNALFTYASRHELSRYFEMRRSGELGDLSSLRDFARSYDTMAGADQERSDDGNSEPRA